MGVAVGTGVGATVCVAVGSAVGDRVAVGSTVGSCEAGAGVGVPAEVGVTASPEQEAANTTKVSNSAMKMMIRDFNKHQLPVY